MKRSDHFNVVAGKYLDFFPLSVNGLKYVISGVDLDNRLVLRSDDKDTTCNFSDFGIDSSHIFVDECNRMIYEAKKVFIEIGRAHV